MRYPARKTLHRPAPTRSYSGNVTAASAGGAIPGGDRIFGLRCTSGRDNEPGGKVAPGFGSVAPHLSPEREAANANRTTSPGAILRGCLGPSAHRLTPTDAPAIEPRRWPVSWLAGLCLTPPSR